jgi:hypothetical protein
MAITLRVKGFRCALDPGLAAACQHSVPDVECVQKTTLRPMGGLPITEAR